LSLPLNILRYLKRALIHPTRPNRPARPFRQFLKAPVLFDLVGFALQALDLKRSAKLEQSRQSGNEHHRRVHDYNLGVTNAKQVIVTRRAEKYYQILDLPPRNLRNEKLLIIGPRNILELFIAWLYGFSWKNIMAIDLYSNNPKIIEMNMEEMDFPDAKFDAVAMSATLAYAENTEKALSEVFRVLKPGGRFAFGQTYVPNTDTWQGNSFTGKDTKTMLDRIGFEIYFYDPVAKINSLGQEQTSHDFGVGKPDLNKFNLDRIIF
jgi:SAM-dependent methyltransferase